jgi:ubiquinol-cytochrome c reductase cytochrome b subunit
MQVGSTSTEVSNGALLFHDRGCEYCHTVAGTGGRRGPDLTSVAERLTEQQITLRILNGGYNMPSFAGSLKPADLTSLVAFLKSRSREGQ